MELVLLVVVANSYSYDDVLEHVDTLQSQADRQVVLYSSLEALLVAVDRVASLGVIPVQTTDSGVALVVQEPSQLDLCVGRQAAMCHIDGRSEDRTGWTYWQAKG